MDLADLVVCGAECDQLRDRTGTSEGKKCVETDRQWAKMGWHKATEEPDPLPGTLQSVGGERVLVWKHCLSSLKPASHAPPSPRGCHLYEEEVVLLGNNKVWVPLQRRDSPHTKGIERGKGDGVPCTCVCCTFLFAAPTRFSTFENSSIEELIVGWVLATMCQQQTTRRRQNEGTREHVRQRYEGTCCSTAERGEGDTMKGRRGRPHIACLGMYQAAGCVHSVAENITRQKSFDWMIWWAA